MRLSTSKVALASGGRLISGYRLMFKKSEIEKAGFKEGDEFEATYEKDKIILKKIEPSG